MLVPPARRMDQHSAQRHIRKEFGHKGPGRRVRIRARCARLASGQVTKPIAFEACREELDFGLHFCSQMHWACPSASGAGGLRTVSFGLTVSACQPVPLFANISGRQTDLRSGGYRGMAAMIEFLCAAQHRRREEASVTLEQGSWASCSRGADSGHVWTRIDPTAIEALRSRAGNSRTRLSADDEKIRLTPATD